MINNKTTYLIDAKGVLDIALLTLLISMIWHFTGFLFKILWRGLI